MPAIVFFIALCLMSASTHAGKITLTTRPGRAQIFERGIDIYAFKNFYKMVQSGRAIAMFQEEEESYLRSTVTFSSDKFGRVNETLSEWNTATQIALPELPVDLVNGNAHYISPTEVNRFFITSSSKEILYTDQVCECVVVIGYCPATKKGFMAHLAYWFQGDLESDLKSALATIREGSNDPGHVQAEVYLITRQASNFAQRVLKATRTLELEPRVSSIPGLIQESEYNAETEARTVQQVIDPTVLDFEQYITRFNKNDGRAIYFDSKDGKVYEKLAVVE